MLKTLLALSLSAVLVGCIDDTDAAEPTETTAERPKADDVSTTPDEVGEDVVCRVLPTSDACAVACDEGALMEFVPAGTCVLFRCTLDDGSPVSVGGCRD